jgi:hypothetical protein
MARTCTALRVTILVLGTAVLGSPGPTLSQNPMLARNESAEPGAATRAERGVPVTKVIAGRITNVDGSRITLADGTRLTIPITVKVEREALRPGAVVMASYEELADGRKIVHSIAVDR